MTIENVLSLIGGICLFLFGMQVMGNALEKRAGSKLKSLIEKLTTHKLLGVLTGLGVTAVIQSSAATTVMVVGFVNSGVMNLKQAINVIMGANVGTTVTAWILSLAGISSNNPFVAIFKPTNFTPILAIFGVILFVFCKSDKKKDTGMILLGFATLMFGMNAMTESVSGLQDSQQIKDFLLIFSKNPILGLIAGATITALIQSSSASVGILQALSSTGNITIGTAIPIIFGQNIGTCITALLSGIGANKNARRASIVHLCFNIIGSVLWLVVFYLANSIFEFAFVNEAANQFSIAIIHSVFNVACVVCLLPMSGLLEKLAKKIVPDGKYAEDKSTLLDERLLATPSFAIDRCKAMTVEMVNCATNSLTKSLTLFDNYSEKVAEEIREEESTTDKYEDMLGTYLVKLSSKAMSKTNSIETTKMLHMIGDFERISDHAVNIVESFEEINSKGFKFSDKAHGELTTLISAVNTIVDRTKNAYINNDSKLALRIEPLEQVIDGLKNQIRSRHIIRLQSGDCTLDAGFVLSDLLTNLERVADHCSNIASCIIEMQHASLYLHEYIDNIHINDEYFKEEYEKDKIEFALPV